MLNYINYNKKQFKRKSSRQTNKYRDVQHQVSSFILFLLEHRGCNHNGEKNINGMFCNIGAFLQWAALKIIISPWIALLPVFQDLKAKIIHLHSELFNFLCFQSHKIDFWFKTAGL